MNNLQVLTYQSSEVRMVIKNGEPWWIAKDVCDVFGETNRNRAMQYLDDDEKGYTQMTTPGGAQNLAIVNESGLYSLLFAMQPQKARGVSAEYISKRTDQLRDFRRWVTHEVLPSIRKTGGYTVPKPRAPRAKPVDMIFRQRLNMARDFAKVTGIPLGIALAHGIADAEKLTGEDYTHWKLALPARTDEKPIPCLNATKLGAQIGVSAQDANKLLESAGWQVKSEKQWRLTEAGKQYGEEYPYERNGHSDYRILWNEEAAGALRGIRDAGVTADA